MADRHTTIRASQLRNFTISAEDIKINSITADKFVDSTISGSKIADGVISEPKLDIVNSPIDGYYLRYTTASGMGWSYGNVGVSDHGALTGLADDDHTQYFLADGTRNISGIYTQSVTNVDTTGTVYGDLHTITVNPSDNSSSTIIGSRTSVETADTAFNHSTLLGFAPRVFHYGTGTITDARGLNLVVRNMSTGTVTNTRSGNLELINQGGGIVDTAKTINTYIANASGTINTGYLFYGEFSGTVGTKYGVYVTGEDSNYLSGDLVLGDVVISNKKNTDIDTGTETVDTFADTAGDGCTWHFVVKNGTNLRSGEVIACWESSANTVEYTETSTNDIGDTTGLTLAVDIDSNNVRLRATASSDNWSVKTIRMLL